MRMVNAMGFIDDELVLEAMTPPYGNKRTARQSSKTPTNDENHFAWPNSLSKKTAPWIIWGGIAACLVMLIIAGAVILPMSFGKNKQNAGDGRYKSFTVQAQGETAILWPWEYRTIGEKYQTIVMNGMEYWNTDHKVSESMRGKMVGTFEVTGYDEYKEESHVIFAEAYELTDASASLSLAVKLEDGYYVFRNMECLPAGTLGELLDQVNLSKFLRLNWFEERGTDPKDKRYVLNDDSYFWKVLTEECRNAKFIDDQNWMTGKREYLGFSVSSDVLGVQNVALYVTKDGYLWTNVFGPQYLYDIGEEAAEKVISHCKEHSGEIEAQPFANAVIGTITEITEEYFLVDDSCLCKDPKDGITYKVLLNDIRISRYVQKNYVKLGDTVEVLYRDQINEESDHTICEATSASKVTIIDGKAYIFE